MPLILAIEPDRRQAAKVGLLIDQLGADLVFGETAENALAALGARVPDLVLTSQLLLPKDEAALAERLRELGAAGAHVQTLVIPVLRGEEGAQKKKSGGLFGRLRRGAAEPDKGQDGCDPAVFGAEITEYLERGAAERAALAAAQAELEAAWAEQPPSAPATGPGPAPAADLAPAAPPAYAAIDVHPDMVIDDPEALFGEFAAIPIRRDGADAALDVTVTADATSDEPRDVVYEAAAAAVPVETRRTDEDWEEIQLDADDHVASAEPAAQPDAPVPPPGHVDLTSESVDLDAFVRELDTVPSSANAQPVIPVVDLSHVLAGDIDLPAPTIVDERELIEERRATFEAEVTAAFTAGPADAAATPGLASRVEWPEFAPPQPLPVPTWEERPQTDWRAAIDLLPPPPSAVVRPSDAEVPEAPAAEKAGWQDMLSAIRRDIKSLRTDDAAMAPAKPKPEFTAEPLVFPVRPAVAAGVLSEFEAHTAQRVRETDESVRQAEQLAREAQDRARAAEEALRAAAAAVETSRIVEPTEAMPIDSTASIFTATIDADLAAVAFAPAPALPAESAPSIFDARIDTDLSAVAFAPMVSSPAPAPTPVFTPVLTPVLVHPPAPAPDLTEIFFAAESAGTASTPEDPSLADDLSVFFAVTQPEAETQRTSPASLEGPVSAPPVLDAPRADVEVPAAAVEAPPALAPAAAAPAVLDWLPQPPAEAATPAVAAATAASVPAHTWHEPAPHAPEPNAGRPKQGKGKKKRRNGQTPAAPPPPVPTLAHRPSPEWGFFDPQSAGFGPLLARLNQAASDLRALPRR